jgi:hypothetical protein
VLKKVLVLVIALALMGTLINDVGRYVTAKSEVRQVAARAASVAASTGGDRDTNGIAAVEYALQNGAQVYQYDEDAERAHVWALFEVQGTWIARPLLNWIGGNPLDVPLSVEAHQTAFLK